MSEPGHGCLGGKRVVVTGASRGIGRAAAVAYAANGADVVVNGRDAETLATTRDLVLAHGVRCEVVVGSVADYAVCEELIGRCVDAYGGIDHLLNNAGITRDRTLMKMSEEEFDDVIAVNLRGTWACGKLAATAMRQGGGGGTIVNVVSNTAFQGGVGQTNYGASKAAVAGMTRTWTRELARYDIRVNAIWPIALTDMTAGLAERLIAEGRENGGPDATAADFGLGDPEQVAKIAVFLADDRSREINGQIITFNGMKLALWSHPREVAVLNRPSWELDEIAEAFDGPLAGELQELYEAF